MHGGLHHCFFGAQLKKKCAGKGWKRGLYNSKTIKWIDLCLKKEYDSALDTYNYVKYGILLLANCFL